MIARRRYDRFFARALVLSLVIHLSTVTLFRIVFRMPQKDVEYFNVAIVEAARPSAAKAATGGQLTVPGPNLAAASVPATPPEIQLPTLRYKELTMLQMRQEAIESRSRYDELLAGAKDDLLSQAASSFSAIGQTLSRLTFGATEISPPSNSPTPVSRPAPGFEAYIEWTGDPRDRRVLTVAPVDKLWGVSPSALPEPVTLGFRVDRDGNVERVIIFSPVNDPNNYAQACGVALRHYRFEPLLGDGPPTQSGTFIVRAATSEAP